MATTEMLATGRVTTGPPVTEGTTTTGLSLLLGEFDRDLFFARHWERRSLHLRHGDASRFADLVSHESFFAREIGRCQHLKASTRDGDGWNVEVPIRPEQAEKLFRAGMTICASVLDEKGPAGRLIDAYRADVATAAPPHVNCYYSPDGRGYGLHFDTHPVWIVQVAGRKHWTVSQEPAVVNPPFNVIFPPGRDRVALPWITLDRPDVEDAERFMHVVLEPGDVLYIPAGGWHAARAEGPSLALTLALGRMGTLDLLEFLVSQTVHRHLREVTSRLSPLPRAAGDGQHRRDLRVRLDGDLARVKALVQRIDADDLLEVYASLADNPEAVLASRQFVAAREQVTMMKSIYARAPQRGDG